MKQLKIRALVAELLTMLAYQSFTYYTTLRGGGRSGAGPALSARLRWLYRWQGGRVENPSVFVF
jgi:hypothetical protein